MIETPKDKDKWGDGQWQSEIDYKRWTDSASGLECLVIRCPVGAWCGYVGVNSDHPAFGASYYKSEFEVDDVLSGKAAELAPMQKRVNDIRVHGGLTFSGSREDDLHWFGFDCSHAGDLCPKIPDYGRADVYRDLAYVENECRDLARQLAAMMPPKKW